MVPADIDWKHVESKYIKDELYEHINAPKWLDLSAPDSVIVDDEAWFCRADCKHPKCYEDFKKFSPSPKMKAGVDVMPLGERKSNNQSLKRRGGAVLALLPLPTSPVRSKNKGNTKNTRIDLENQDPNMDIDTYINSTPETKKQIKFSKEEIKSSEEKVEIEKGENAEIKSNKKIPKLKSTSSARNLFSGRDILSQLSEFCHELKRIAVGKENARDNVKEEEKKVLLDANSRVKKEERSGKSVKRNGKLTVKVENNENISKKAEENNNNNSPSILKEVRAHPPTPQKFPSPSTHRLHIKTGTSTASPLKSSKPPLKPETQIQGKEETRELVAKDDNEGGGGGALDMFWFFKPCTA